MFPARIDSVGSSRQNGLFQFSRQKNGIFQFSRQNGLLYILGTVKSTSWRKFFLRNRGFM
jgi:hypothetical protein